MGITVPVAIHLDHGHYEDALECIEVGYTSIMFDGSHLPVEEVRTIGFTRIQCGGCGILVDEAPYPSPLRT